MSIGYACKTIGVWNTDMKSCMLKNVSNDKLTEVILHNLSSLEHMIDYNIKNGITLFRISSDLISFGSSKVNELVWWEMFQSQFERIGRKIKDGNLRVSMHPGQYTVLNSPKTEVVENAILDLNYHTKVLDCLGVGQNHKIILHIGGIYGDKTSAKERFIRNYNRLDDSVKKRLVLENDDKSYHIGDLLDISRIINAPIVFDNLHNIVNPYDSAVSEVQWIMECNKTWNETDGCQKIHYSQQDNKKKPGSHSETIRIMEFLDFYEKLDQKNIDIMLEVKDKNLSAIKCINCVREGTQLKDLEVEWSRYKYNVLEHSHNDYLSIRRLFKEEYGKKELQQDLPIIFYRMLEHALEQEVMVGGAVNAASHVWGYYKDVATEQERRSFMKKLDQYQQGQISIQSIKNMLGKLAVKYEREYLLNSFYVWI